MEWPAPAEAQVWSVDLDLPDQAVATLGGMLTADELLRAGRMRAEESRRRAVVTRAAVRALLGRYLGRAPAELSFAAGAQGKPRLASPVSPLRFNLSHSAGRALIAVTHETEVGVDIEQIRPRADLPGVGRRVFTEAEREAIEAAGAGGRDAAFYRHWVAKEAFVKATGRGIESLRSFEVLLEGPGGARLTHVAGDPEEATRWTLAPLDAGPGFAAAAVVATGGATVGQPRPFDPLK